MKKKWLMIAGCIMLYFIGKMEEDYVFAFSAISLIIAKFFWIINNSFKMLKKYLSEFLHLPIYTIIFIVVVVITMFVSFMIPQYCIHIIFGLIIGVLIGIIACAYIHKEDNQ